MKNTPFLLLFLLASSLLLSACGGDSDDPDQADRALLNCVDSGGYWYDEACNVEDKLLSDVVFPDANLSECVADRASTFGWTYISEVTFLYCSYSDLQSAAGIDELTALEGLYLSGNQLTEIDLSQNTALEYLDLSDNQLTEIDLSQNTALEWLGLRDNPLSEIDVTQNTVLETLYLLDNQLTEIDVS